MKNNKLRNSAKMQECTFQIPGDCNNNPETTVLCHLPDDSGTGKMGGKSSDQIAAFGCSGCHDVIDGRKQPRMKWDKSDMMFFKYRALIRTWNKWQEMGLVKWA